MTPHPALWRICIALCLMATPAATEQIGLPALEPETAAQFGAIGRLGLGSFEQKQGCTATLIAPNLIVTAAHCVSPTGSSERFFAAGWDSGVSLAHRLTTLELRHPDYATDGTHSPVGDIGLIVLDADIVDIDPIPLADRDEATILREQAAILGYHHQSPDHLSGRFDCPFSRYTIGLKLVGCPVIGGNSGSPVLGQTADGEWRVIGIISSNAGPAAVSVELNDWLRQEVALHASQ